MSKNDQEWFVAERTRALMHLTRRDGLVVTEAGWGARLKYVGPETGTP